MQPIRIAELGQNLARVAFRMASSGRTGRRDTGVDSIADEPEGVGTRTLSGHLKRYVGSR